MDKKKLTEQQIRIIESVIKKFEEFGIKVMAEFLEDKFHIVIPVDEIAAYFKRQLKPSYGLEVDTNTIILNNKAYIDIRIWRK